jgi:hypothetical protein
MNDSSSQVVYSTGSFLRLMIYVGPRPSFEEYLVLVDHLVLRLPVEDGAHGEAEITRSRHLLWNLFRFFGEYCNGEGMLALV